MTGAPNPWLPRRRAADARLRLHAFPCAGGGSTLLHGLVPHLAAGIELVPLRLPGRERRLAEPAAERMDELVDGLEQGLAEEFAHPHAFLGHSLGALVAYELARRRRARGAAGPAHLVVCASRAPQRVAVRAPIGGLADGDFLDAVEALGGLPAQVRQHTELLPLVLPALRADFRLYESYRFEPGPELDLPLTVLGGRSDRSLEPADLEAWRERTHGPTELHWFAGGHFFLQEDPAAVAALLNARLAPLVEAAP